MSFIARGVITDNGSNAAWVGKYTYVSEPNLGFYQWDGLHKAKRFTTADQATAAAYGCNGPVLQLPAPETIEAIQLD